MVDRERGNRAGMDKYRSRERSSRARCVRLQITSIRWVARLHFDLTEANFQALLEVVKELPVFHEVFDNHDDPASCGGTKSVFQFNEGVGYQGIRNLLSSGAMFGSVSSDQPKPSRPDPPQCPNHRREAAGKHAWSDTTRRIRRARASANPARTKGKPRRAGSAHPRDARQTCPQKSANPVATKPPPCRHNPAGPATNR